MRQGSQTLSHRTLYYFWAKLQTKHPGFVNSVHYLDQSLWEHTHFALGEYENDLGEYWRGHGGKE